MVGNEPESLPGIIGIADEAGLLEQERAARAEAEDARARLAFLASASVVLHETIDLDERLSRLVRIGVPRLADGCAIHLLDESGLAHPAALHHRDPMQEGALRDLFARYPVRLDAPVGVGAAIRQGARTWLPEITDEVLASVALDHAHLEALRMFELTSAVAVPLLGRTGPIGALTFFTVGGRTMSDEDVVLAEELGARTGTVIHNARLIRAREEADAANAYQAALLRALHDSSVDGMIVVDADGNVVSHNARFLDLWGFEDDLVERGDAALLEVAMGKVLEPERFIDGVRAAYSDRPTRVYEEVVLRDGRTFDRYGSALLGDDGTYLGFAWSFRDVTVERRQRAELAAVGLRSSTLARTLQQSLLPHRLPVVPGLELAARYHPALDGLAVGGDFYDVFPCGDDWLLVLGDVCGKGAGAAALTALIRYTVRAVAFSSCEPGSVLRELNAVMLHDSSTRDPAETNRLATACCIRLRRVDAGMRAEVACGGHPLPLVLRQDGSVEAVGEYGTLLGALSDVVIPTHEVLLEPGDCIISYTDGVNEARDGRGHQLEEALFDLVAGLAGQEAAAISEALEARALEWQRGVARDDIAILAARVEGAPSPGRRSDRRGRALA